MVRRATVGALLLIGFAVTASLQPVGPGLVHHQLDPSTATSAVPPDPAILLGEAPPTTGPAGVSPGAPAIPAGVPITEDAALPRPTAAVPAGTDTEAGSPYDALLAASGTLYGSALAGASASATTTAGPSPPGSPGAATAASDALADSSSVTQAMRAAVQAAGFGGPEAAVVQHALGPDSLDQAMATLYEALGLGATPEQRVRIHDQAIALDPRLRDATALLVFAAADAQVALAGAYGQLDPATLHLLIACAGPRSDAGALPCGDPSAAAEAATHDLDRAAVARAGLMLASAIDQAMPVLKQLRAEALKPSAESVGPVDDLLERYDDDKDLFMDPKGLVEIGGLGDDVYTGNLLGGLDSRAQVLTIDLLGRELYANTAGGAMLQPPVPALPTPDPLGLEPHQAAAPPTAFAYGTLVSISIDLFGADQYTGTYGVQGSGRMGLGLLIDQEGNDRYTASSESQGFGSTGIGLLLDTAGMDQYVCDFDCQGHGRVGGLGVLKDAAGNDVYTGHSWTQGVGVNQGAGFLVDAAGDDRYSATASGATISQGATDRIGLGVLMDNAGSDSYTISSGGRGYIAGIFPYNTGVAIFRDRGSGSDTYAGAPGANGSAWSQGTYGTGEDA